MEAHVEWDKTKYPSHRPHSNHFLKRQGLLFPGRVYLPGFLSPSNLSKPNNSNPMLHQVAMKALYLPHQNQLYQCPKYTFYSHPIFFSILYFTQTLAQVMSQFPGNLSNPIHCPLILLPNIQYLPQCFWKDSPRSQNVSRNCMFNEHLRWIWFPLKFKNYSLCKA